MSLDPTRFARINEVVNPLAPMSLALEDSAETWGEVSRTIPDDLSRIAKNTFFSYLVYAALKAVPFEPMPLLSREEFEFAINHRYFASRVTKLSQADSFVDRRFMGLFKNFTGLGPVPYPDGRSDQAWIVNVLYLLDYRERSPSRETLLGVCRLIYHAARNVVATVKTEKLMQEVGGVSNVVSWSANDSTGDLLWYRRFDDACLLFNKALDFYDQLTQKHVDLGLPSGVSRFKPEDDFAVEYSPWLNATGDRMWIANMLYSKMMRKEAIPGPDGYARRVALDD